jgi:hypothetical protein
MFHPAAKLAPKRHGPFPIVRVLSPITYELRLPVQWKLHPVFHVDLLTPYRETEFHSANYNKPPPDLIDGEEEYEVERIVASRHFGRGRKLQYLVKWKGYPDAENQWVNKEDVFAEDAIKEFQNLNSDPGVHIRRARTDSNPHPPFSECLLLGLSLAPSLKTCSTSTLANPNITLNSASSATSLTSTAESTPVSVRSRAASTTTITEPMIIPEAPYAPPEPPFCRYADTHDSIGGACHVLSRTSRASQAFHTDYHWDCLRPYLVLPPRSMCRVMCRVMCQSCVVLRPSTMFHGVLIRVSV